MTEYVTFRGVRKQRFRCPKCGRTAPDDVCEVHGEVEGLDLTESVTSQFMVTEIIQKEEESVRRERVDVEHGYYFKAVREYEE